MDEKILDLTELTDEAFEVAKKAIEAWKEDGAPIGLTYRTVDEIQQLNNDIAKAHTNSFENGILWGGIALIGGFLVNKGIDFVADFVATKIKEKQS